MTKEINSLAPYNDESGNKIIIGNNVRAAQISITFRGKNSTLQLEDNADISTCSISLGDKSFVKIGEFSKPKARLFVGAYSSIVIGNNLSVTHDLYLRAVDSTEIIIGDDCLFATRITIRTSDGHPIYDAKTKKRINPSASIYIDDHVWIGDDVKIFKKSKIGYSSVIGACSLVSGEIPHNCIAAGIPAKVIRNDIVWEHTTGIHTEAYYYNSTKKDD